jgi:hypothetical protein
MVTHTANGSAQDEFAERCPWCDSEISHAKFVDIQRKIRIEEQKKMEAVRSELARKFRGDADARIAAATKELATQRDSALSKVRVLETARIAERKKLAEVLETQHKKQVSALEGRYKQELARQREILGKDKDSEKAKLQVGFNREREAYQKKISDLGRQLERKTAGELGDGAEIELFDALRDAFPQDQITRVAKGEAGADILHQVMHKGQVCGTIIFDSKNRQIWHKEYVEKLRSDQRDAGADHAVLSTTVFPTGKKELCIVEGVIVINPARAVHVVQMLRQFLQRVHVLGLSNGERTTKAAQLYKFIISETYARQFKEVGEVAEKIAGLDVQEVKEHQKVWQNRGRLTARLKNVVNELDAQIGAIVESRAVEPD